MNNIFQFLLTLGILCLTINVMFINKNATNLDLFLLILSIGSYIGFKLEKIIDK